MNQSIIVSAISEAIAFLENEMESVEYEELAEDYRRVIANLYNALEIAQKKTINS
jgi:hypothetical protein